MGSIKLKNIKVYAYHGCLVEEKKIGSDYRVDLKIKADLFQSAHSDHLADTVDYVHLNRIVKQEMTIHSKLLEHAAERILIRILDELPLVTKAVVDVSASSIGKGVLNLGEEKVLRVRSHINQIQQRLGYV